MSRRLCLCLVLSGLLAGPGIAADEGVEPVEQCVRGNLPERTSKQTVELTSTDRTGGERTLQAEIHWQQDEAGLARTLIEIEAPAADRGSRYLWVEQEDRNDTWVCLPELQRVRRVHPRSADGSLFGTDFSYEDIQHVQRISKDSASERLPDATVDGREVYRVHTDTSGQEGSAYHHIRYTIDKQSCLPLRIEFFDAPDHQRKILKTDPDSFSREGHGWVARSVTLEDLTNGTSSRLVVEEIEVDVEVPDRMFTLAHLERRCR